MMSAEATAIEHQKMLQRQADELNRFRTWAFENKVELKQHHPDTMRLWWAWYGAVMIGKDPQAAVLGTILES